MSHLLDPRRLLYLLAAYLVLPPAEELPANDETLHRLLADLALGEGSTCAEMLRAVAGEFDLPVDELARRAKFLLACLVLPASGTHYEMLGVRPDASTDEIRKRWAALMQRYHPDRFGGTSGWLDGQARRLIEAYQTLKDPGRRRAYDAELSRSDGRTRAPIKAARSMPRRWFLNPVRWRWVPLGITTVGVVAGVWAYSRPAPPPLPTAALPAAPKLLERWGEGNAKTSGPAPLSHQRRHGEGVSSTSAEARTTVATQPIVLPSLKERLSAVPETLPSQERGQGEGTLVASLSSASAPGPSEGGPHAATATAPTTEGSQPVVARSVPGPATPLVATAPVPAPSSPAPASSPVVAAGASTLVAPPEEPLAVIRAFRQAYERKDLRAVMNLFGSTPRERKVKGRAAVEALYARNFAVLEGIHYELTQLDVVRGTAEEEVVVQARFRIRATHTGPPARPLEVAGPIRWLLRSEAGRFQIVGVDYEGPQR